MYQCSGQGELCSDIWGETFIPMDHSPIPTHLLSLVSTYILGILEDLGAFFARLNRSREIEKIRVHGARGQRDLQKHPNDSCSYQRNILLVRHSQRCTSAQAKHMRFNSLYHSNAHAYVKVATGLGQGLLDGAAFLSRLCFFSSVALAFPPQSYALCIIHALQANQGWTRTCGSTWAPARAEGMLYGHLLR